MTNYVTAGIDGSGISSAICDAAAWVSGQLSAPVKFLHILEKPKAPMNDDFSGSIGFGSREQLLDQLVALDEQRGKLAIEHGKYMLENARQRALGKGAIEVEVEQRHGEVLEALINYESQTRLFVMGRSGEDHKDRRAAIGSHLENVVRAIRTPILVAVDVFNPPANYMLAYDGSETADNAILKISESPLLQNIPGHILMVSEDNSENRLRLEKAAAPLSNLGQNIQHHLIQGPVVETLQSFQKKHAIGLKIMGAYGHSRLREFFVGSNTSRMIVSSPVPVLLLR